MNRALHRPADEQAHRANERARVAQRIAKDPSVGLLRYARAYVHTRLKRGTIAQEPCACGESSVKPTWPDLRDPKTVLWRCRACLAAEEAQRNRPLTPRERLLAMTLPVARKAYAALPATDRAAIEAVPYFLGRMLLNPGSALHTQALVLEAMERRLL
jgi:hypothetical protein